MSISKKGIAVSPGFAIGNVVLINQARTIVCLLYTSDAADE